MMVPVLRTGTPLLSVLTDLPIAEVQSAYVRET